MKHKGSWESQRWVGALRGATEISVLRFSQPSSACAVYVDGTQSNSVSGDGGSNTINFYQIFMDQRIAIATGSINQYVNGILTSGNKNWSTANVYLFTTQGNAGLGWEITAIYNEVAGGVPVGPVVFSGIAHGIEDNS